MKKLLVGLCAIFICTFAIAHSIEWYVDGSLYQTTTCEAGDSITPPTAPEKYGYHFVKWSEYAQLEYIESTGTQWIDTGITDGTWEVLAQSTAENPSASQILFMNSVSNMGWAGTTTSKIYDFDTIQKPINEKYLYNQNNITVVNSRLFVGNSNRMFPYKGKLFYCKIRINGVLVRDLVPAKRDSDNVVGMYDTVSDTFFTNQGTGEFIPGPEVSGL